MRHMVKTAAVAVISLVAFSGSALARDQIRIVGSSTVFPFSTAVAETFGRSSNFKTPVVESTGSGGGLKLFCEGVGPDHPDITNSSRAIKDSEVKKCAENGVTDILEVKVGFDGIVIANSQQSPRFQLNKQQIFLALAKEVPGPDGKLVANPYQNWKQIDPSLPDVKIRVMGPPPTSGTRDAFLELAMEPGAESLDSLKALKKQDKDAFERVAFSLREDGGFVETGENDNLIVQKLEADPDSVGIFGYSYLEQNADRLQGSIVGGVEPTFEAIADGRYGISRSMYFYLKKAHVGVIPGLKEYAAEFTSSAAMGMDGYLADKGLIPLPEAERAAIAKAVDAL